jgi:hypothetical protein
MMTVRRRKREIEREIFIIIKRMRKQFSDIPVNSTRMNENENLSWWIKSRTYQMLYKLHNFFYNGSFNKNNNKFSLLRWGQTINYLKERSRIYLLNCLLCKLSYRFDNNFISISIYFNATTLYWLVYYVELQLKV